MCGITEMRLGLFWLKLVPLVALLWGLPTEAQAVQVSAVLSLQNIVGRRIETVNPQPQTIAAKEPLGK